MRYIQQGVCLVLILACLVGAAAVQPQVDQVRDTFKSQTAFGADAAPPEIVLLTHLLGGFRGLLVDAVWLRAVELQQQEQYWELFQLYDWMGKLEPHMEEIWVHLAWNMSYNLVAELEDSEARWQWIERALDYLLDDGLRYNPQSGQIMKELSWILYHKIGKNLDLHNKYYKHRWALIMNSVMGPREVQDFEGYMNAPHTVEELIKDEDVKDALKGYVLEKTNPLIQIIDNDSGRGIGSLPKELLALLFRKRGKDVTAADFLKSDAGRGARKILNYVVAKTLREKYKMARLDIAHGLEMEFGQFDWRMPEPHAIYWAAMAVFYDPRMEKAIDYDRMIMFSISQSMRRGKIAYMDPEPTGQFITIYDLSKIEPLDRLYERMIMKHPNDWDHRGGASVADGHMQFLKEAARILIFSGYKTEGEKYHNKMYKLYDKPDPYMDAETFALGHVKKGIDENWTYDKTKSYLDSIIYQSLFFYVMNQFDECRRLQTHGRAAWKAYAEYAAVQADSQGVKIEVRGPKDGRLRHAGDLPSWKELNREMVRMILRGETRFPPHMIPILRAKLGIKKGEEENYIPPSDGIAPPPPSSLSPGGK